MSVLLFSVAGEPIPQGSKHAFGRGRMVEGADLPGKRRKDGTRRPAHRLRDWRRAISAAAAAAAQPEAIAWPYVELLAEFVLPRPRSHYTHDGIIRPRCRELLPGVRPDLSKLVRGLEDACTGYVWSDDAKVVSYAWVRKRYADATGWVGVNVQVRPVCAAACPFDVPTDKLAAAMLGPVQRVKWAEVRGKLQ